MSKRKWFVLPNMRVEARLVKGSLAHFMFHETFRTRSGKVFKACSFKREIG